MNEQNIDRLSLCSKKYTRRFNLYKAWKNLGESFDKTLHGAQLEYFLTIWAWLTFIRVNYLIRPKLFKTPSLAPNLSILQLSKDPTNCPSIHFFRSVKKKCIKSLFSLSWVGTIVCYSKIIIIIKTIKINSNPNYYLSLLLNGRVSLSDLTRFNYMILRIDP